MRLPYITGLPRRYPAGVALTMFGQNAAASAVVMFPCAFAFVPSGSLYVKMTSSVVAGGRFLIV